MQIPIRINKFEGLYTNYDENNLKPELFIKSENYKHTKGKLIPIPEEVSISELPDVDAFHNEDPSTWELEDYIICDLTNDVIPENISVAVYRIHFAIFKRSYVDGSKTYYVRDCWFKNDGTSLWYELSSNGNLANIPLKVFEASETDPIERYGDKILTTDIDGKVFTVQHDGVLKIYMPHDCFWFGRITRVNKFKKYSQSYNQFYLDRILEPYYGGTALMNLNTTTWDYTNLDKRRLSADFFLKTTTTGTITADDTVLIYPTKQLVEARVRITDPPFFGPKIFMAAYTPVIDSKNNTVEFFNPAGIYANVLINANVSLENHFAFYLHPNHSSYQIAFHAEYFNNITVKYRDTGAIFNLASRLSADIPALRVDGDPTPFNIPPAMVGTTGFYLFNESEIVGGNLEFTLAGEQQIADVGFASSLNEVKIIITAQLDNREEIVLIKKNMNVINGGNPFAFLIETLQIPIDNNLRVTRYFIYLKFNGEIDYQQYKEFITAEDGFGAAVGKYISTLDATGIYLTQTIGFAFTEEKDNYQVKNQFLDYIVNNGFGLALYRNDSLNVYRSTFGRGKIMPDLFYPDNRIDIEGVTFVKKLLTIGSHIGLVTSVKMVIIQVQVVNNTLVFDTQDALPYGIVDREDALEIQGGAIIKTQEGIFLTDGFQVRDKISEAINDLVIGSTTKMFYNPIKHELYWIYTTTPVKYNRYRFDEKVWETIVKEGPEISKIVIDPDGQINFISPYTIHLYNASELEFSGEALTIETDIGKPEYDKYLDEIYIDSKGLLSVAVYGDGILIDTFITEDLSVRNEQKLFYPISNRFPFIKLQVKIFSTDPDSELYDLTLMLDIIPRRHG